MFFHSQNMHALTNVKGVMQTVFMHFLNGN